MLSECPTFLDVVLDVDGGVAAGDSERRWRSQVVALSAAHHGVSLLQAGGAVSLGALHHGVPLLLMVFVGVLHRRLYAVPISSHVAARIIVLVIHWILRQHNELVRT